MSEILIPACLLKNNCKGENMEEKQRKIYQEQRESLENSIWTTRKSRINAEERLLSFNNFVQGLNIYYSCLMAGVSILGLVIENKALAVEGAILSPVVVICIVFLNAQRYAKRAQDLKRNYIELNKLLYEVRQLELKEDPEAKALQICSQRYCELMEFAENHRPWDYWKANADKKANADQAECPNKGYDKVFYIAYKTAAYLLRGVAIGAPLLLFVWLFNIV